MAPPSPLLRAEPLSPDGPQESLRSSRSRLARGMEEGEMNEKKERTYRAREERERSQSLRLEGRMSQNAKQSPQGKAARSTAADGRIYFSYAQIAETVARAVPRVQAFAPDVLVAIGGGGYIPARMLRTEVKVPILAISLELYDDATKTANDRVLRKQWFDETPGTFGALVRGKRVLIVDEVDDTRTTLEYAVAELRKTNAPAAVGVLVVHNKLKEKKGTLPDDVTYISGEDVPNAWNCYPWDAMAYGRHIRDHEELARKR